MKVFSALPTHTDNASLLLTFLLFVCHFLPFFLSLVSYSTSSLFPLLTHCDLRLCLHCSWSPTHLQGVCSGSGPYSYLNGTSRLQTAPCSLSQLCFCIPSLPKHPTDTVSLIIAGPSHPAPLSIFMTTIPPVFWELRSYGAYLLYSSVTHTEQSEEDALRRSLAAVCASTTVA